MCPRWSYVPKTRGIFYFFHPQDRTMERVATDLRPVFREQKYFGPGRKQGRREFFLGGAVWRHRPEAPAKQP